MAWANNHIAKLKRGETVKFRPHGRSMEGRIESGQLVTVVPIALGDFKVGDAVLCKVQGRQYLHLVKAFRGDQVQIGNNKGYINGWTSIFNVFGKVTNIEA